MRTRRRWLGAVALLALLLALPLLLNLEVFRPQVHRAVERQVGRAVEVASLTARALPRPGIVGHGVIVHEGEGFGAEPFLYADEVRCDLGVSTLWRMRLECASLHFARPSINVTRNSEGAWNLASLLLHRGGQPDESAESGRSLPVISADDARINFKQGTNKQVYTLVAGRLRAAPSKEGRWQLTLEASPTRTDRRLSETGRLRLEGEVGTAREFSALPFQFHASLPSGSLAQLWILATGEEPPVRAQTALDATVEGTPAEWNASGSLSVSNLRRWDLVAPRESPRWAADFRVRFRAQEPVLEIRDITVRTASSELRVEGRVRDPGGKREWDLQVSSDRLQLDEFMTQLAGLRQGVSPQARIRGTARLNLNLRGEPESWAGELDAPDAIALRVPGLSDPVELRDVRAELKRGEIEVAPLGIHFSPTEGITLSGRCKLARPGVPYQVEWSSAGVELGALRRLASALGWDLFGVNRWQGRAKLDLSWQGQLLGDTEPVWRGTMQLENAEYESPELNDALGILQAVLQWRENQVGAQPLVVRLGEEEVTASLLRRGRVGRWQVEAQAERLSLEKIEKLLNPARQGLLTRLVRLGPSREPRWALLSAAGEVETKELLAGPLRLTRVEAQGEWQSGWLELSRLRFRAYGGSFDGRLQSDFRSDTPHYRLAGNLKEVKLADLLAQTTELEGKFDGLLGADLTLQTEGKNPRELLQNLEGRVVGVVSNGTIAHINLLEALANAAAGTPVAEEPTSPTQLQSLAGEFRVGNGRVEFDAARMITARASLELSGWADFEGRLELRLNGVPLRVADRRPTAELNQVLSHTFQLSGTLHQPQVRPAQAGIPVEAGP